jgi:hypothetical protein
VGLAFASVVAMVGATRPAPVVAADRPPDLNGEWRFDPKHSDAPPGPGGPGGGGGSHGGYGGHHGMGGGMGGMGGGGMGGGWGHHGGGGGEHPSGGPDGAPQGQRPVRLPELMHITQTNEIVSFEDSAGAVLQEITTIGAAKDTLAHALGAQVVVGRWEKDKLEVDREGPRGKVVTTFSIEDDGKRLVMHVKMEGNGEMPSREFKRSYVRVNSG